MASEGMKFAPTSQGCAAYQLLACFSDQRARACADIETAGNINSPRERRDLSFMLEHPGTTIQQADAKGYRCS